VRSATENELPRYHKELPERSSHRKVYKKAHIYSGLFYPTSFRIEQDEFSGLGLTI